MNLPQAKKQLGQHWLEDKVSLDSIANAADIRKNDIVLEIGPGTGTLTDVLIKKGAQVVALEYDKERVKDLRSKYASTSVDIREGDIRSFDLGGVGQNYKIVANIPYYLTANLLRKLVDDKHKPQKASLLVQKEVAERVCAEPGNLTQIAVFVQVYYEVKLGSVVPAALFMPPPKVDSQVLILTKREEPLFAVNDTFFKVVKAGFSEKRKKLRSSLSGGLSLSKPDVEKILKSAKIDPNARAQELGLKDWHRLASSLPLPL